MSILDWTGPSFLTFYAVVLGTSFITVRIMASPKKNKFAPEVTSRELDPYEIAYLSGGERRALSAAIASLHHRGFVSMDAKGVKVLGSLPADAHSLEKVLELIAHKTRTTLQAYTRAAAKPLEEMHARLCEEGLLIPHEDLKRLQRTASFVGWGVFAIGAIKVGVGLSRDRPVLFLVLLTVLAAIVAAKNRASISPLTHGGKKRVTELHDGHSALATTAKSNHESLNHQEIALAAGLFGIVALNETAFGDLRAWSGAGSASASTGWGGCGGGCGGGSGCGGGGGGCGGCGGCGG